MAEAPGSELELMAGFSQGNKYQGEVYFGLFRGLKILNYGFGDRTSRISGKFLLYVFVVLLLYRQGPFRKWALRDQPPGVYAWLLLIRALGELLLQAVSLEC